MSEALARSRGFALLGDLFLHGVTPVTRAAWSQVPDAAALLPLEADAAELHARVVLLDLVPHEGAFRAADGLLGGDILGDLHALRARTGLEPLDEADHLGHELRWLGFLAGAAADAARDGVSAAQLPDLEREVLDAHVLRWLPGFVAAMRARPERTPFYDHAAELALKLAVSRRVELGGAPPNWALPPAHEVLENPRNGLRAIAEHLALPCQAGGHFARSTLIGLARTLELPAGFGNRADLIEGLLLSAAHYGRVPELAAALRIVLAGWDAAWKELDDAGLAPLAAPWRARIHLNVQLLDRLDEAAAAHAGA